MLKAGKPAAEVAYEPDLVTALVAGGEAVYEWDLNTDRIDWTGAPHAVLGVAPDCPLDSGDAFLKRVHPEDLPHRMIAMSRHFEGGEAFVCEYRIRDHDGRFRWLEERGIAQGGGRGARPQRILGVLCDVTDQKETHGRLHHLVNHDPLTGHYNRARLREALEHELNTRCRHGGQGAYLLVSIDKLALVAEAYGEEAADAVVMAVSARLETCRRAGDIVGRLAADRFGMILDQADENATHDVAADILAAVREAPVATPAGPLHVTVSVGATGFPLPATCVEDAIAQVDCALRGARRRGSDCYSEYRELPAHWLVQKRDLAVLEQVQRALRNNRLVLAYQPVVDAASGDVAFYEGLARMKTEDGRIVAAAGFVPIVEEMGLMRPVDRRVLELGLGKLAEDARLHLSLNVSGLTANDSVWLSLLKSRLSGRPDMAHRLTIEITETVALYDIAESARFVQQIRELGCRVALDDFGAGFTSFRHLRALDVDMVKIDGSFVRNVAEDVDNQLFVRSLLHLAHGFGLTTVCEWVENEADSTFLRQLGAGYLQGYLFGKPEAEPAKHQDAPVAAAPTEDALRASA